MESIFGVFICLEALVRKYDLRLHVIDTDHSIEKAALDSLDRHFPPELFNRTETHDYYVYSYKSDLPAKPLLDLRSKFYSVFGVDKNSLDDYKEKEIREVLLNADVQTLVSFCRYYGMTIYGPYNYFRWEQFENGIKTNAKVFHNSVSVLCSGIGIYYSNEPYRAELSGPVKLLGNLLMKMMEGSPLNRLLSIQAIDLDDDIL